MTNADTPPLRRSIGRLTAFSDGVVSIAATLLVLPLVDTAANERVSGFGEFFARNGDQLLVLALSFAVILRFWLIHHSLFDDLTGFTPGLFWANAVWLFSIVFLPFPTQLIAGDGAQSRTTDGIYIGTMFVTTLSGLAMKAIISRHREIVADGASRSADLSTSVIAAITMGIALLVVLIVPTVGLWALLLLFLDIPAQRIVARRGSRTGTRSP